MVYKWREKCVKQYPNKPIQLHTILMRMDVFQVQINLKGATRHPLKIYAGCHYGITQTHSTNNELKQTITTNLSLYTVTQLLSF